MPKLLSNKGMQPKVDALEADSDYASVQCAASPGLIAWLYAALQAEREALRADLETRHDTILRALAARENTDVVVQEPVLGTIEETASMKSPRASVTEDISVHCGAESMDDTSGDKKRENSNQQLLKSPSAPILTVSASSSNLRFNSLREVLAQQGLPMWHPRRLVQEWWFDAFFCCMIFVNTFVLAVEVQFYGCKRGYQLGHPRFHSPIQNDWPGAEDVFAVSEWIFGFVFTLEVVLKILGYRLDFVWDMWNWFDSIITGCWLSSVILSDILSVPDSLLKLARMARLLRLLRLVRAIKGFDSLYIMTTAMKGSITVLWWSFVLLLLVQTMIGFFVTSILEAFYFNNDSHPIEQRREVFAYFGTTVRCMFTMFELTLANWPTAARVLVEYVSEYYTIVTVLHKLTIGFAVIGVINGVFMQETFKVAATDDFVMLRQKERDRRLHMAKMGLLFEQADDNGDGVLDPDEFRNVLMNRKVKTWLAAQDLRVEDGDKLFKLIDVDGDQGLTAEELVIGVERLKGPARSIDFLSFMNADRMFKAAICQKLGIAANFEQTESE
eukprot:TRINITY_DN104945_c0_g1_i1.p1 TRINITY_DN104945_c0_g1~~TRINITY_DN104945_c0_g1_i1.p1  ORF type:complete len:557 (-),score=92.42 TRINITY_DN104945_c0_g1_i1:3-1673(-)